MEANIRLSNSKLRNLSTDSAGGSADGSVPEHVSSRTLMPWREILKRKEGRNEGKEKEKKRRKKKEKDRQTDRQTDRLMSHR